LIERSEVIVTQDWGTFCVSASSCLLYYLMSDLHFMAYGMQLMFSLLNHLFAILASISNKGHSDLHHWIGLLYNVDWLGLVSM